MLDYMKGWIPRESIYIPPIEKKGFPEKVMIRKKIPPILPEEDSDETIILHDFMKRGYVKRISTGEIVNVNSDSFIIGKSTQADFVISGNQTISREHARIFRAGGRFYIEDMDSLNHTYVDGERITESWELEDGTGFQLSNEEFQFTLI